MTPRDDLRDLLQRGTTAPGAGKVHWRFQTLLEAPHRLAFATAALVLAVSATWWAVVQVLLGTGVVVHWAIAPSAAHGLVMTFGFMPMFFAGFLFTAGPKWLELPPVSARRLMPSALAHLGGWGVFAAAVHGRDAALGATLGSFGMAAVATGWATTWLAFWRMLRSSRARDLTHARAAAFAGAVGVACLWLCAAGLWSGSFTLVRAATGAALWGFAGVTFVVATHRMIPFFSAAFPALDAWRPQWLLWTLVVIVSLEALGVAAESASGAIPWACQASRGLVEVLAGAGLLALAHRWTRVQNVRVRLIAMLHAGFVWLGLAFLLSGASHGLAASTGGAHSLGLAPLHAFTMGFLGSTMFTMVTRVSCGFGGRTIAADDVVWRLFWVLQLSTVLRVAASVLAPLSFLSGQTLISSAAAAWMAVCVAWAARYGHWYGTPRADGRPG